MPTTKRKPKPTTKRKPTTTAKRHPTIGADPLDALVPPPRAERRRQEREVERQQAAAEQRGIREVRELVKAGRANLSPVDRRRYDDALVTAKGAPPAPARPAPSGKVRATFHLPGELLDLARDAVVALSRPPVRLTLATLVETALRREVERLARAHHGGKPFPKRAGDLKGGRPIRGSESVAERRARHARAAEQYNRLRRRP